MSSFSREHRLTSKLDFQSVFANPSKVSNRYLLALFQPNQLSHARVGIIIGKHLVHRAVDRNRMRRVIRESFRQHQAGLKNLDIVVLVRSKCNPLDKIALRQDIDKLWTQVSSRGQTSEST